MPILAQKRFSIRELRVSMTANITATVQAIALLASFCAAACISIAPELRIHMEFCLVAICVISSIVLLAHQLRHEAGTAIWLAAVTSALVACDLYDKVAIALMIAFMFCCLWLMWYVTPYSEQASHCD